MRIHISNLHNNIIEADLQHVFCFYGEVDDVLLMRDKLNNRSLCHAFIEMPVKKQAEQAVVSLDRTVQKGKRVSVKAVRYDPVSHSPWSPDDK
jgi:RNA recognition motif-containing protein